jgi:signal transduction histidine kinase
MSFPKRFARQRRALIVAEALSLLGVIAVLDLMTSYRIRLLPFYAVPIFVLTWFCGRKWGIAAALLSAVVWWSVNWSTGDPDLHGAIAAWEVPRHVGFFLIVAVVSAALRTNSDIAAQRIALLEHSHCLEREIVNISEAEQRRIGQDLHDGICQNLAALSCAATSLRNDLRELHLSAESKLADDLANRLRDTVVQTRELAHELVPAHVAEVGLTSALESLTQSVTQLQGVSCTFQAPNSVSDCDELTATHLYRVAQEAINNATKHGKASHIDVSLQATDQLMTLQVLDNGVGISESKSNGMGLAIMRARARLNGGELQIEQPESGGTKICCSVRINHQETEIEIAAA